MSIMKNYEIYPGIYEFKDVMPHKLCDDIIKYHEDSSDKYQGRTGGNNEDLYKNSIDCPCFDQDIIDRMDDITLDLLNIISKKYKIMGESPLDVSIPQIQLSKNNNGWYKGHSDFTMKNGEERFMALIYYLNDVEEGGETDFPYQEVTIKPKKGKLVVFNTSWMYYHIGVMPTSGDKYIATRFLSLMY